jgi:hypothetical protein
MAVHDAAYSAIVHLHGEHIRLEETGFRYIPYTTATEDSGYYTVVCTPYVRRRYDPQVLVQYTEALDRTARALAVVLYATRPRLYDALIQLLPAVSAGIATCELRWDFPEEEGMMQYSRDKYFPQL